MKQLSQANVRDSVCFYCQFSDDKEAERFCQLVEYAEKGKVIVGWEEMEPDYYDLDDEGAAVPLYDETDRSDDSLYPLAEILVTAGCYDYFAVDSPEDNLTGIRFQVMPNNDKLILAKAQEVGISCHKV